VLLSVYICKCVCLYVMCLCVYVCCVSSVSDLVSVERGRRCVVPIEFWVGYQIKREKNKGDRSVRRPQGYVQFLLVIICGEHYDAQRTLEDKDTSHVYNTSVVVICDHPYHNAIFGTIVRRTQFPFYLVFTQGLSFHTKREFRVRARV
jgi:hypothetical protein